MNNYENLALRPIEVVAEERVWCYATDTKRWYGDYEGTRMSEDDAIRAEIWWLKEEA